MGQVWGPLFLFPILLLFSLLLYSFLGEGEASLPRHEMSLTAFLPRLHPEGVFFSPLILPSSSSSELPLRLEKRD